MKPTNNGKLPKTNELVDKLADCNQIAFDKAFNPDLERMKPTNEELRQETRQETINEFEKMIKSFDNRLIRELKEVKIERRNKIATEDNCDGQETILRLVRNWLNENLKEKLQEMKR